MLKNYSPLLPKYNELWAKFGPKPIDYTSSLEKGSVITSQEEAIKWSLKLKEIIDTIASEKKQQASELLHLFCEGVRSAAHKENKLNAGLSRLGSPEEIVARWKLDFSINSLDDLFLSDENDISSVMNIE